MLASSGQHHQLQKLTPKHLCGQRYTPQKDAGADPEHFTSRRSEYSLNPSCQIQDSSGYVDSESKSQQIPASAAPPGSASLGQVPTVSSPVIRHSVSAGTTPEQPASRTGAALTFLMILGDRAAEVKRCCKVYQTLV